MKLLSRAYIWIIFGLLYAPILMLVLFSFNEAGSLNHFSSFSLYWYRELFRDAEALKALKNSLVLAVSSSLLATVIGTFAALGIDRMRSKVLKGALTSVTNIPMMNPDIVTGVSMMLLFVAASSLPFLPIRFGLGTMLIAHIQSPLRYSLGPSPFPSDGQAPDRGGAGSWLHAYPYLLQGGASRRYARYRIGSDARIHLVP